MSTSRELPYSGLRVVEFTHMVMGPTCGMVLADLGAEVIKVEPIDGEGTRRLLGAGAGFFPMFNRNKKSIAINLHDPAGAEVARQLAASADVVAENFKPGTMAKYGLDYASLSAQHPRLIYASLKGFLPGPYEHRTALDEVVQMMGGLAYMTGRPGDPLRAGTSVNDIMGGMFGAIGVLGALIQRGVSSFNDKVKRAQVAGAAFAIIYNNAGDGFVMARHLHARGYEVAVLLFNRGLQFTGDAAENFVIIERLGLHIRAFTDSELEEDELDEALAGLPCRIFWACRALRNVRKRALHALTEVFLRVDVDR